MPILSLQRQMRELGRIRTGVQVKKNGRSVPSRLDTFRLTSTSRELVEAAAEVYGGTLTPWKNGDSQEYEVITTVAALDIVIPPGQPVSQWFEMWSGGGCQRRCDGETNVLTMGPCECPTDVEERRELAQKGQACKETTRLNVMLPALPDIGVWRLESHGYYASVELAGSAEILAMASASGRLIQARLRLEQREKKVPGKPTNKYAVPIIEVLGRMTDIGVLDVLPDRPALAPGAPPQRPALPPTAPPATSDFRAPTPTVIEAQPATLVERLRVLAEASSLEGGVSDDQKVHLRAIATDVGGPLTFKVVFVGAFGEDAYQAPTAAQADAVLSVAGSFPDADAFAAAWGEAAA